MSDPTKDEAVILLVGSLIGELEMVRKECEDLARAGMQTEADLLEAQGTIDVLEHRLAEANAELRVVREQRDMLGRTAGRMEADLFEAHGRLSDCEGRLADALRELAAWNAAADSLGLVGRLT